MANTGRSLGSRIILRPGSVAIGGLLLLVLSGTLLFGRLNYALQEPDEGRYALIPLTMTRTGDYAVPHLKGMPYNDKPPLAYWLVAAGYRLFGVQDCMARALSASAALAMVLLTYFWTCRRLGPRPGLWSGLLLATTAGLVGMGRMMLLDTVFSFLILMALCLGDLALAAKPRRMYWWLMSAGACGLAILTKGPSALVLVLPPLVFFRWLDRSSAPCRIRDVVLYLLTACAVAAPWYLLMLERNPAFLREFFLRHHLDRFLHASNMHSEPFWYYLPALLAELVPWTGVLVFLAVALWNSKGRDLPAMPRLCLAAAVWIILFFSMSAGKLPTYIFPALPLLAPAMGWLAARLTSKEPMDSSSWWTHWQARTGPKALAFILVSTLIVWGSWETFQHRERIAPPLAIGLGVLGLTGLLLVHRRLSAQQAWLFCVAAAVPGLACAAWSAVPSFIEKTTTGRDAVEAAQAGTAEGWTVATYSSSWHAANFYRGGDELPFFSLERLNELKTFLEANPRVLLLLRRRASNQFDALCRLLPNDRQLERVQSQGSVRQLYIVPRRTQSRAMAQPERAARSDTPPR